MRTNIRNRITMYKTSSGHMRDNNPTWSGMPALADAMTRAEAKLAEIDETAQQLEGESGAAGDKESARDLLETRLFLMCQALSVVAHRQDDHELSGLVDVSAARLQKMDGEELSNRAARVVVAAGEKLLDLATMNVTQATIDALSTALEGFNELKERPRQATAQREALHEKMNRDVRELSSIYRNEIDPLVNLLRDAQPEFVAGYRAARVIVDRGATHAAAGGGGNSNPPTTPTP